MARLTNEQATEMSKASGGGFNFFALENREVKRVRFLCHSAEDVDVFSVHSIKDENGRYKNVDCLRAPNEPVQKCPLCESGNKAKARVFLLLQDVKDGKVYVWERSAKFLETLNGYAARYGDLINCVFEVERRGAKGDVNTEYLLYFIENKPVDQSTLPAEKPDVSKLIVTKSFEECKNYIQTGSFGASYSNAPLERRETSYPQATPTPTYEQPTEVHIPQPQTAPQPQINNSWETNPNDTPRRRGW